MKDFQQNDTKDLSDLIQYDAYYGATPDTVYLRYAGPIPVFLWGDNSTFEAVRDILAYDHLSPGTDLKTTEHIFVKTRREFYAFKNKPVKDSSESFWPQKELCFSNCAIARDFVNSKNGATTVKPLPLMGRVFTVSLAAIRFLDLYFDNSRSSYRDKVSLVDAKGGQDIKAYTYTHNPTFFLSKGGPDCATWVEREGNALTNYPVTINAKKDKYYARCY